VNHFKSVHLRHLHVEKQNVDLPALQRIDRVTPVLTLAHQRAFGFQSEQPAKAAARDRFVVNY